MNTFKVVLNRRKELKETKDTHDKDSITLKREANWNEQFYKGRLEDYNQERKQKIFNKYEQFRIANKIGLVERKINFNRTSAKNKIDVDLLKLWELLNVKKDYSLKFQHKLFSNFSDKIITKIVDKEKKNLNEILDIHNTFNNLINKKQAQISQLKNMNMFMNKNNIKQLDHKILNEIKEKMDSLKNTLVQIFNLYKNYFEKYYNEHKFTYKDLSFLQNNFISNIVNEINTFINGNKICGLFQIKNIFDFFETDFKLYKIDKKNNCYTFDNKTNNTTSNEIIDIFYLMLQDNIKSYDNKEQLLSNVSSSRDYKINKGDILTEKDIIVCHNKEEEKNSNSDISHNNIINTVKSNDSNTIKILYNDISKYQSLYQKYFSNLSESIKTTLNIKSNIYDILTGTNPQIMAEIKDNEIQSLCCINYPNEGINDLEIYNISDKSYDSLNTTANRYLQFINQNYNYKNLYINIFYSKVDNKLTVNKDINKIFSNLGFKWIKLENNIQGCFQRMGICNNNYNENNNKSDSAFSYIKIQSDILITEHLNTIKSDNDFFNIFYSYIISKSNDKINDIKESFSQLQYYESNNNNINDLKQFLNTNKINIPENQISKIKSESNPICLHFSINIILKNYISVTIDNKNYLRINSDISVAKENSLNQTMYVLLTTDPNIVFICAEMNDKFIEKINSSDSIYKSFDEIYQNLNQSEDIINELYIPEINEENESINTLSKKGKKVNIISSKKTTCNITNKISYKSESQAVILKGSIFYAIVNTKLLDTYKIPAVYCGISE